MDFRDHTVGASMDKAYYQTQWRGIGASRYESRALAIVN